MASNFIRPELLSLNRILKDKLFEIPKFQRPYSWKKAQRDDLFLDIDVLLKEKKKEHFMSTIVCLAYGKKRDGTNELERMQIVDGQQRLTTLIILLKAIQLVLKDSQNNKEKKEADLIQKLLNPGKRLILLQTNHQSAQIFRDYLISGVIPNPDEQKTIAEKDVALAISDCRDYVTNKAQGNLLELLSAIKNRLNFIFYTITDEKIVYTVFEVLNSRGLPVASLDICKSMLMRIVYEKYPTVKTRKETIESLHNVWESIYSAIGTNKIDDSELLRFAATLCYFKSYSDSAKKYGAATLGKALSEEESLRYFESIAKSKTHPSDLPASLNDSHEDICILISKVIKKIAERLSAFNNDIRKNNGVTNVTQARLLAVSIDLSSYTEAQKEELESLWEKITFRIYGLHHKDSRSCVGDYVRLARDIYFDTKYDDAKKQLNDIGKEYPIESAIKELTGKPWYLHYIDELKYVLYRYEEELARQNGVEISRDTWNQIWSDTPSKTVEHIYPETFTFTLKKNWPNPAVNSQEDLDAFVHNIGNLTLLPPGMNSKLGQKTFDEKKKAYKDLGLRITNSVISKRTWTKNSIIERENIILKFIGQTWA